MKILWITNTQTGDLPKILGNKNVGGTWMDVLIEDFISSCEHELTVITSDRRERADKYCSRKVTYYVLPGGFPMEYDGREQKNIEQWKGILSEVKPDIINIWGTEFTLGLAALKAAENTPSVIYMQGILHAIARGYYAGMTDKEVGSLFTLRDALKKGGIKNEREDYAGRSENETEIISRSGNIICENKYCEDEIALFAPKTKVYYSALPVNKVFFAAKWKKENVASHIVMSNASGYPLKGLHKLLEALAIVKKKYPDVSLWVPGDCPVSDGSIKGYLRKRGYSKYLERLIKKLRLKDNIVWLGALNQTELAQKISSCSAFVLASAVENHSSSLKEAMAVGAPCIASRVGGVPEYAFDGKNALLYDFGDVKTQAECIERLLFDGDLCEKLSENARADMTKLHSEQKIYEQTIEIYKDIIDKFTAQMAQ